MPHRAQPRSRSACEGRHARRAWCRRSRSGVPASDREGRRRPRSRSSGRRNRAPGRRARRGAFPLRARLPRRRFHDELKVGQECPVAGEAPRPDRVLNMLELDRREVPGICSRRTARLRAQEFQQRDAPIIVDGEGDPRLARRQRERGNAFERSVARARSERAIQAEPDGQLDECRRQRHPSDARVGDASPSSDSAKPSRTLAQVPAGRSGAPKEASTASRSSATVARPRMPGTSRPADASAPFISASVALQPAETSPSSIRSRSRSAAVRALSAATPSAGGQPSTRGADSIAARIRTSGESSSPATSSVRRTRRIRKRARGGSAAVDMARDSGGLLPSSQGLRTLRSPSRDRRVRVVSRPEAHVRRRGPRRSPCRRPASARSPRRVAPP